MGQDNINTTQAQANKETYHIRVYWAHHETSRHIQTETCKIVLRFQLSSSNFISISLKTKPAKPQQTSSYYPSTTSSRHPTRTTPTKPPQTTILSTTEILDNNIPTEALAPIKPAPGRDTLSAARNFECGVSTALARPETRIVGGKNAPFGRYPWQVSVRRTSFFGFSSTHRCGGAVLSENFIATAGLCAL